jgi:cytochrome c oxidase assembly protein subunit 11
MSTRPNRNGRIAGLAALAVLLMLGLSFAAVPLYRVFCQATGFNGTTQRGTRAPGDTGHFVSVRFDANIAPGMGWDFHPVDNRRRIAIGARNLANFYAHNLTDHEITGSATFNVTPAQAGQYFTKIQCFCFTQQHLSPGQEVTMPVVFYVDPRILDDPNTRDISEITLSYTFYPVDQPTSGS